MIHMFLLVFLTGFIRQNNLFLLRGMFIIIFIHIIKYFIRNSLTLSLCAKYINIIFFSCFFLKIAFHSKTSFLFRSQKYFTTMERVRKKPAQLVCCYMLLFHLNFPLIFSTLCCMLFISFSFFCVFCRGFWNGFSIHTTQNDWHWHRCLYTYRRGCVLDVYLALFSFFFW